MCSVSRQLSACTNYQLAPIITSFRNVLRLVQSSQRITRIIVCRFNRDHNELKITSVTVLKHSYNIHQYKEATAKALLSKFIVM